MTEKKKKSATKKADSPALPGMSDDEMVDVHAELNRDKHPPTIGFLPAPLIFVFMFGCLIFVCSIQLAHSTNYFRLHPPKDPVELTEEQREAIRMERKIESGKKIFGLKCASCHQPSGLGIPGQFPPLAGSKWATTDPGLISKIVINGLKGEILVKGETWGQLPNQNMVPVPIDDREIANVVTYVRQAWGNSVPEGELEVTEEQVSKYRSESSEQEGQWTGEQLKDLYPSVFAD